MTIMNKEEKHKALEILESLPDGWDYLISKYGLWYHVVIRNDGLKDEPVYSRAGETNLLRCVEFVYNEFKNYHEQLRTLSRRK